MSLKKINYFRLDANGGTLTLDLLGQYILTSSQGGAIKGATGMTFITITPYTDGCSALMLCGGDLYKQINISVTAGRLILTNQNVCDTYITLHQLTS